jgi:murein L,D-transpeptidase YcbB/YkuD
MACSSTDGMQTTRVATAGTPRSKLTSVSTGRISKAFLRGFQRAIRVVDVRVRQRPSRPSRCLVEIPSKLGFQGHVDDFMRYWFEKDSNLNARVLELVDRLKRSTRVDIYIATGQEHYRAQYLWSDLGLSKRFDRMFYSARLAGLKATFASLRRSIASFEKYRRIALSSSMTRSQSSSAQEAQVGTQLFSHLHRTLWRASEIDELAVKAQ